MKKSLMIFGALLIFSSCKDFTIDPGETHYEIWKAKKIHDYSIDQVRMCFCPEAGDTIRIMIRSDTISFMQNISKGWVPTQNYFTIDSLFGIIRAGNYDSIVIRYNDIYGYPEFIDIDPQQHPVDGGVVYESFNLHVKLD